jgi:plastocyanin
MRTITGWAAIAALVLFALPVALPAGAAELSVSVVDRDGRPVEDAVVTLRSRGHAGEPVHAVARKTVDQRDLTFVPYLEILHPGDEVVFRNSDMTRHHVYSFSPAKAFEFVLAPHEQSAPQRFDRTGVVAVGCNIHDGMIAWLYVSDAPWSLRTDASGRVAFDDLPAGDYEVRVWQPRLRPGLAEPRQSVTVGATPAALRFPLVLLPDTRALHQREHGRY